MRAVISQVFFEVFEQASRWPRSAPQLEASIERLRGFRNVVPSVGPHAPYTVSLEGLGMAYRLAERLDVLVHFHLAETAHEVQEFRRQHGQDLVPALDAVGFLGPRLIAAHGIWLTDDDARLLASRGVTISHCPASNMKLGSGWSEDGAAGAALPAAARGRGAGGAGHRRRRVQQQPRHVRDHEAGGAAAEARHRRPRRADRPRGLRHGHRRRAPRRCAPTPV